MGYIREQNRQRSLTSLSQHLNEGTGEQMIQNTMHKLISVLEDDKDSGRKVKKIRVKRNQER